MERLVIDVDSPEWLGCGVDGHEPECLCDVHVSAHTSIGGVGDVVSGMWMGEEIVRLRGYGEGGWTPSEILDFLADILRARDEWSDDALLAHSRPLGGRGVGGNGASAMGEWADVRNQVRGLIASGTYSSVADVLDVAGVTAEQFTASATSHKYSFGVGWLLEFERAVTERQCASIAELASRFGITPKVARNLWSYWGTPLKEVVSHKPSVVMVREMLTEGCGVDEIIATVYAKLGVHVSRTSVHKTASRMRKGK